MRKRTKSINRYSHRVRYRPLAYSGKIRVKRWSRW